MRLTWKQFRNLLKKTGKPMVAKTTMQWNMIPKGTEIPFTYLRGDISSYRDTIPEKYHHYYSKTEVDICWAGAWENHCKLHYQGKFEIKDELLLHGGLLWE